MRRGMPVMGPSMIILGMVVGSWLLVLACLVWALPRTRSLTLTTWPSVQWIVFQALASLATKSKKRRQTAQQELQVGARWC